VISHRPERLVPERLPSPGPSFLKEQEVAIGERRYRAGMSQPAAPADDWWAAILWVADDAGIVSFRDLAPSAGPPPNPPLARLGPAFAGSLSGLILEADGRLQIRLGLIAPPDDPERPWRCPAIVRAGFRWEPARAAAMRTNELAKEVLTGFRRSVEGLSRP
jgi:hypothetical protein